MRLLPRLTQGSLAWCLPLADCSASALETVLLAPSDDDQRRRLAALLASDPALALWTVCQADFHEGACLTTSGVAAEWLAPQLLRLFDPTDEDVDARQVDHSLRERYAHLAAASVAQSQIAKQQAERTGEGIDPEAAAFVALLHAADQWLSFAAVETGQAEQASSCLPDWLADEVHAFVTDVPSADMIAIEQLQKDIVHRWMTDVEGVVWRLPALVAKLGGLQQTAVAFERRLEEEKIESIKELAYGAGHEINNPLANISARAQTLLRDEHDPERRRRLAAINSQAFRAHEMIADLMLFARPPKLSPERLDLGSLVDEVAGQMADEARRRGTSVAYRPPDDPVFAHADRVQLGVVLSALCKNALEALGSAGTIHLDVRCAADESGDRLGAAWAEIVITDDGPGIAPEVRRHIFDPFYSGREAGRGLGFGLSKCWRIVTDHGGRIEVDSGPGRGATFTVRLPQAHSATVLRAS